MYVNAVISHKSASFFFKNLSESRRNVSNEEMLLGALCAIRAGARFQVRDCAMIIGRGRGI